MLPKQPLEFYSEALAGTDRTELQGRLIVIEGPDSVGRSTQVARRDSPDRAAWRGAQIGRGCGATTVRA